MQSIVTRSPPEIVQLRRIACCILLYLSLLPAHVLGQTEILLDDSDYLYPRFSPDGNFLAYVELVREEPKWHTPIYLYDFSSNERREIISGNRIKPLGYYSATVYGMVWKDNNTLEVDIHDGDVGIRTIQVNVQSGEFRVIEYSQWESLTDRERELRQHLSNLNMIELKDIDDIFYGGGYYELQDGRLIFNSFYLSRPPDSHGRTYARIWIADFKQGTLDSLVRGEYLNYLQLGGGFRVGNEDIVLLHGDVGLIISQYRDSEFNDLKHISNSSLGQLELSSSIGNTACFELLPRNYPYLIRDCLLMRYSEGTLEEVSSREGLIHGDVTLDGNWIVLNYWEGEQRHISVMRSQKK